MNNAGSSGSTSRSTPSSSTTGGGIIAIDSDEDATKDGSTKSKSTKRKRASNGSAPSGSEVLDLLDSEEEKAIKRSRTRKAQSRADRNSGAGSSSRVTRSQLDDVIVVEDD